MIRRETDAELVNRICNQVDVLPFVSRHGGTIDWTPAVESCFVLSNGEDAVMILEQTAERDWQVMTIFDSTCRGRKAIDTGLAMREYMLPYADMIFGSIPNSFRHAQWFYRKMGGEMVEEVISGGNVYVAQPNETLLRVELN